MIKPNSNLIALNPCSQKTETMPKFFDNLELYQVKGTNLG